MYLISRGREFQAEGAVYENERFPNIKDLTWSLLILALLELSSWFNVDGYLSGRPISSQYLGRAILTDAKDPTWSLLILALLELSSWFNVDGYLSGRPISSQYLGRAILTDAKDPT